MLAITQPASTGITAQAASASTQVTSGAKQEHALVGAGRDHRLLEHEFEEIGEGLQQSPWADHVGAAADLHRRPDFAVGEQHIGHGDQQNDEQQHALRHHDDQRPDIVGPERGHVSYSAAVMVERPCASAEHSAMTAEQRAIGLVK